MANRKPRISLIPISLDSHDEIGSCCVVCGSAMSQPITTLGHSNLELDRDDGQRQLWIDPANRQFGRAVKVDSKVA